MVRIRIRFVPPVVVERTIASGGASLRLPSSVFLSVSPLAPAFRPARGSGSTQLAVKWVLSVFVGMVHVFPSFRVRQRVHARCTMPWKYRCFPRAPDRIPGLHQPLYVRSFAKPFPSFFVFPVQEVW